MATADMVWRKKKTIKELESLLRESGETILNGRSKLSLSTGCLSMLADGFREIRDEETGNEAFEVLPPNSQRLPEIISLQFLYDFIQKTKALKLTHSNETIQGHVSIAVFRALRSLDLRKIPLHLLRGLQQLRPHLAAVACSRCLRNIQELFETCGGDMSSAMSWPQLHVCNLSYNNIQELDGSLRLLPVLELLDVSHNNISRTDSHLLCLTELRMLNLGYNIIEVIPSFALSSRLLLRTLILRNNNISQLDGLQELVGLHELDLANNCLCCHDDMQPIRPLKKLRQLMVSGNPLSYEKRHRCLTFSFLHPMAFKKIVLDGVAISKKELSSCSVQHPNGQAFDDRTMLAVDNLSLGTNSSLEQSFDRSYDFVTSTGDESEVNVVAGTVMRRRGASRRRTLKKSRKAKISDVDSPLEEDKSSKVMTSTDEGHLHMKEKFEVIRNQLGPSWLKSLEIHQSSGERNGENATTETRDSVIVHCSETSQTSQVSTPSVDDTDTTIPNRSPPEVTMEMTNGVTLTEERKSSSSRRQSDAIDWKWQIARAESVDYGVESEPFIASFADAPADQFLLTVTDRYILEKDLDGEVTEVLDLQCLRGLRCLAVDGGDSEIVRLVFDYVRKDRQERKYLLEDSGDVKKFCQLLQPMLEDGQMTDKMKQTYECMKCGATFNESRAEHTFQTSTRNSAIGELEDVLLCPACSSALIVQLDDHQVAQGWQRTASTPVGRFSSPIGNSPGISSAVNSSLRKSLFITDSACSVTMATDASTSYQSCQTALSSSFQSLSNSPSPRGGFIAQSYPNSAQIKLNNNVQMQTGATETSKVLQPTGKWSGTATVTTDTGRVAHFLTNNGSSETVKSDSSAADSFSTNGVDVADVASHAPITTRDSDTFLPANRHSLDLSCATDDSDILVLRNNPSTVSLGGTSLAGNSVVTNSETDSDIAVLPCPGVDPDGETLTSSPRTSAIDCQLSQVLLNRISADRSSPYGRSHDPSPSGSLTDKAVNSMVSSMYEKSLYESDGSLCDTTSSDGEAGGFSKHKPSVLHDDATCRTTQAASGDVFQYCYDDYSQVDHRLKLHLAMKLFAADEEFQLLLRCGIVLPKKAEFPALLVMSSSRLYVLRIAAKQSIEHPEKWLKVAQQQTLARIRSIQLGLGGQLFRLDFGTDCLTALLRDEARCHGFIRQFTAVLQESVFYGTRQPPEVTKDNRSELTDLTQNVLLHQDSSGDVDDIDTTLLKFVMCHLDTSLADENRLVPVSLIVTPSHICLAIDGAACRVAAPADGANKKSGPQKAQFTFKARQKLLDLTSIDLYKTFPTEAALRFVDECSQEETVWRVALETKPSLLSLVSSISQPWETEFGVELQVNVCIEPEQS